MKSSQLLACSGNIQLKKARGFQIQGILPAGYNMKTDVTTSAPPLPSNALKSTAFCNGVKDLFQSRHIDYLHTALFGQRGTKISHPTFAALSSANAPILGAIVRDTPQPANELMMVARGLYKTNLENMWASNKVFNKSLNKLLDILLRVHLAPKRESHYWKRQQTKAKKQPEQVVNSTRNSFHNAIRSEKYKLQRYQRKAQGKSEDNNWAKLARNSQERITHMYADAKRPVKSVSTSGTTLDQAAVSASGSGSFTTTVSIPTAPSGTSDAVTASNASFDPDSADMPIDELLPLSELIDEEDDQEEEEGIRDLPRRRIMILKATLRNLLVRQAGKSITHIQLKKERPDITEEENRVCMLLGNLLLPYIPTRDHYSYIGFQLPFLLLANDIFCSVGYHKFAVDLCPISSCGSLHAMRVDAASLYALCTRGDDQMDIFDFQGFVIENVGIAIQYKDAVFNSFFDIRAITQACKSFGLTFAHNLTILPGLTSVRILGTKPSSNKLVSNAKKPLDIDWDTVRELQTRTNQALKKDIDQLETNIKTVSDELKAANKDHKKEQYSSRIKDLKKQWHTDRSKHQEIKEPKAQRYQLFIAIKQIKQQLSNMRTRAFLTRKAIEYRNKDIPLVSNYEPPTSDQHLDSMVFSGTDNGLAVMTETIGMNLNKYKYHLPLHNRFSPLTHLNADEGNLSDSTGTAAGNDGNGVDQVITNDASDKDEIRDGSVKCDGDPNGDDDDAGATANDRGQTTTFEPLPESYKMRAEDVDFGSGQFMRQKITLKDKKTTEEGKKVQEIEQQLPRSSVFRAKEVEDVVSNLDAHRSNGPALRFRSRFASRERSFCAGVRPQTSLAMFIGDGGLCVGSRLKGHLKYGGKWKPRLHSSVATVHTTNERKTSQTCMYCFGPTSHPSQTIKAKDGKTKTRSIHGAFLCLNPACVSVLNYRAIQGRDKTSALAIAVSGLSILLFKQPLPVFNPKPSQSNTGIISKTTSFCSRNEKRDGSGAVLADA
ncbi:Up in starvation [Mucor velutinosus]|uniref:Up in starvation n=1 Tax=Mucor velutinosus TaxID=708070 RepID=A0AAN7HX60_9FUNG|nr:Up in starvation [Mucor velutinosus]